MQGHELKLLQLERGQLARRDEELRAKLASFNAQVLADTTWDTPSRGRGSTGSKGYLKSN